MKKKVSVIALQHPDIPNLYLHGLDRNESTWTLPGGHSNDGETSLEAAHRELEEEAGLSGIKLDKVHEGDYGDSHVTLFHGTCPKDYKFDASNDPDQEFISHKFLDPNNHGSLKFPTNNILIDWQKKSSKPLIKNNDQNNTNLIHYSSHSGLKQIDPTKMGSGVKGLQYKRGVPENKSSFFYTQDSKPEDLVTQNAKSKYIVKTPEKIYDFDTDPENYAEQVLQSNQRAWNEDLLHGLLKQNGYNGVKWSMKPDTKVVQLYHPHPVHEEQILKSELKKAEIKPFQNEQDVDKYLKNGNFSLMTGHTDTLSPQESEKNHNNFLNELDRQGYKYTKVGGKWFGTEAEPSVMIHNVSPAVTHELADKYKQKAYVQSNSGKHNEYTTRHADYVPPSGGSGHTIGGHLNDNYSEITLPNGKPVRFSLDVGYPIKKKVKDYFKKLIKSNTNIKNIAENYAKLNNIKLSHNYNVNLNPEHGAKIAQAYEAMPHNPEHPKVKEAYNALINETGNQFKHLINNGLKISKIQPNQENPYKSSKEMLNDLHNNNHLWYYPTEQGFGSSEQNKNHPMLKPTDFMHENRPLLANDVFRIVHDAFGHGLTNSSFGPKGEHTSYLAHKEMFSPLAQKALASETMGQNNWVNWSDKVGEHNRKNPSQTIYAEQKAGLLPESVLNTEWHK